MARKMPVVGDVISSAEFAFGYKDLFGRNEIITIDGVSRNYWVTQSHSEDERLRHAVTTGKILPKWHKVDYGAYDPSRGQAKFVVERAEMEGGSHGGGMNSHDDYPDELNITARRLTKDGKYDPKGEVINFYHPHGCHSNSVRNLTFHDKMTLKFE